MTDFEAYQEYIQRKHNAFCKAVIRYAARDKILQLRRKWERQISLDYLMDEKFVQFAGPEPDEEYPFIIRRNPFDFKLVDVVPNDSQKRIAMTEEQQEIWMGFIREDKTYTKYYDEFVVLLGTGMRVSEFCGLTKSDLDFENRRIRVDHQLVRERGGKYYVEKTKTECGCRFIPMTEEVYQSLKNILERRRKIKTEIIVDGYSGFLLLDKDDKPKVALHIENEMRWAMKKYKKLYPDKPLPHITPHVFRHTFCTNMANAGMDIKTLQYVMGHSDVGVTLNVYTHASYDRAAEQMAKIIDFKGTVMPEKQRKSG